MAVTSGSCATAYRKTSRFRLEWSRTGTSGSTHIIGWNLYCDTGYNQWYSNAVRIDYVKINGTTVKGSETYSPMGNWGDNHWLASGSINISSTYGSEKSFTVELSGWFYEETTTTGSATFTLPAIPNPVTTPTVTTSVSSRGLNSISATMTVTDNGGASIVDRYIDLFSDSACTNKVGTITGSSGTFTGLTQNTTYYVRANASNGTYRGYSTVVTTSTQSKATITNAPNINHGSSLTVTYSNPSGASLKIALYTTGGTVLCADRTCTGSSYTFTFTDTELDKIYKQYGNSSTTSPYVILRTANTYYDTKTITITLKGNQKTIHDKISGTWRRGKAFVKVSGTWRNGVVWTKVSGTWRRGI